MAKYLAKAGYKTVGDKELPPPLRKSMGLKGRTSVLAEPAAKGIQEGLAAISEKNPTLGEFIRENVPVAIVHRTDGKSTGIAATAVENTETGDQWLVVNSNCMMMNAEHIDDPEFSAGFKEASKYDGEERVTVAWRSTMLHEAGHVLDSVSQGRLTKDVVNALLQGAGVSYGQTIQRDSEIGQAILQIGSYGFHAGPQETAAEVFTATMLGQEMHKVFHPIRDRILNGDYNP